MKPIYDTPLPKGWREFELRNVTVRKRGYSWSKDQETSQPSDGTIPVIRIPNVNTDLNLDDLLYLRDVPEDALRESGVTKDWILFVASNGNPARIGDSVLMTEDREMVFASFLQAIASKDSDMLTPEFLASWLRIHNVHESFSRTSQQTTGLANFSWSAVKKLPIRFPGSVQEQQQIMAAFTATDEAIKAVRDQLVAGHRLKTALMQQLFTKGIPGRHKKFKEMKRGLRPASWSVFPLSRLADVDAGVTLNQDRTARSNGYRYLTVINVQRDNIDLSEIRTLELWPSEVPAKILKERDILVVEGHANGAEIGRAAMVDADSAGMTFQNHLFRVSVTSDDLLPEFLLHMLNSERIRRHWNAVCNTSSGLNTINRRMLRRVEIPLPDPDEQQDILSLIQGAKQAISAYDSKMTALLRLKKSLLQNLLTGKVRVTPEPGRR